MVFTTLNQSFAFHSSPEAFITSRLEALALPNPSALPSIPQPWPTPHTHIAQASILNRHVHIVSSYQQCKDILEFPPATASASSSSSVTVVAGGAAPQAGDNDYNGTAPTFSVGLAYRELMASFFPPPNILLEDGGVHTVHKAAWTSQLARVPGEAQPLARTLCQQFIADALASGATVELYAALKTLAWKLLLAVFLGLDSANEPDEFAAIEAAQETLLRGQFSLFPVAVNVPFYQSPRSRGLKAVQTLHTLLSNRIKSLKLGLDRATPPAPAAAGVLSSLSCPHLSETAVPEADIVSHTRLFTSSIAAKALASLLTATVMNVFLMPLPLPPNSTASPPTSSSSSSSLATLLRTHPPGSTTRDALLSSICAETERLSPPVVGVMRRVVRDVELSMCPASSVNSASDGGKAATAAAASESHQYRIPRGHDAWLYFSAASRDAAAFGHDEDSNDAQRFRFDRYMNMPRPDGADIDADEDAPPQPLAFGAGAKACLGAGVVRMFVRCLVEEMVSAGIELELDFNGRAGQTTGAPGKGNGEGEGHGPGILPGVRYWLGWEQEDGHARLSNPAADVAKGMKQLPCQRPREKVMVRVSRV